MTAATASIATNPASALYASLNGTPAAAASANSPDSAQTRFLTLLTAQIRNQDPLNPLDNAQMTSQLAQISTVDGIERLNATLAKLTDSQAQTQTYQASALVGHSVLVPGSGMDLIGGKAFGGVELTESADQVKVEIKDANGLVMATQLLGSQEAGVRTFSWDGKTDSGAQAVDGSYSVTITATRGQDKLTAQALQYGGVDSILRQPGGLNVNVGKLGGFSINEISQIL